MRVEIRLALTKGKVWWCIKTEITFNCVNKTITLYEKQIMVTKSQMITHSKLNANLHTALTDNWNTTSSRLFMASTLPAEDFFVRYLAWKENQQSGTITNHKI